MRLQEIFYNFLTGTARWAPSRFFRIAHKAPLFAQHRPEAAGDQRPATFSFAAIRPQSKLTSLKSVGFDLPTCQNKTVDSHDAFHPLRAVSNILLDAQQLDLPIRIAGRIAACSS